VIFSVILAQMIFQKKPSFLPLLYPYRSVAMTVDFSSLNNKQEVVMFKSCEVLVLILVVAAVLSTTIYAQEAAMSGPVIENNTLGGAMTYGVKGGDDYIEQQLDILIPVYMYNERSLIFVNPRAAHNDDSEKEMNLGAGYRHLFKDKNLILGGNIYYDSRWPDSDAQFDQYGFGLELMSTWIDARANYYIPEDKEVLVESETSVSQVGSSRYTEYSHWAENDTIYERHRTTTINTFMHEQIDIYEGTLEGWDAEIGIKIPMPWENLETRVFGGYYHFDPNIESERIEGWKGRLEIRALPALLFDAEFFEDDKLFGVDYLVGARMQVPFNIGNAFSGSNPFEGFIAAFKSTKPEFKRRLTTDQVMRDPHIQLRRHAKQSLSTSEERLFSTGVSVLYTDVIFVDDSNGSGVETGTFENPFNTIAEGLTVQESGKLVFVFGGNYNENINIVKDVMLIGEGYGLGNGSGFGSGEFAVLQGAIGDITGISGSSPTSIISVHGDMGANNVVIKGFDIGYEDMFLAGTDSSRATSSDFAGLLHNLLVTPEALFEVSMFMNEFAYIASGVLVENVADFEFAGNIVHDSLVGLSILNQDMAQFNNDIHDNLFEGNFGAIVELSEASNGRTYIHNNVMNKNLVGISISDWGSDIGFLTTVAPIPSIVSRSISDNIIVGGFDWDILPVAASTSASGIFGFPECGWVGILGTTMGSVNANYNIDNNFISEHMTGLGALVIENIDSTATYNISGNAFVNNIVGTELVSLFGGALNFTITDNVYQGGLLSTLMEPVFEGLVIPDMDLAAIIVNSYYGEYGVQTIANGIISGNQITDYLSGISASAEYNSLMNISINDNSIHGGGLGVLAGMSEAERENFVYDIDEFMFWDLWVGTIPPDMPISDAAIAGNYGLWGITLSASDESYHMGSTVNNKPSIIDTYTHATFTVDNNTVENYEQSVGAIACDDAEIALTLTGNTSNTDGYWIGAAWDGTIDPMIVSGNNFNFTELSPK